MDKTPKDKKAPPRVSRTTSKMEKSSSKRSGDKIVKATGHSVNVKSGKADVTLGDDKKPTTAFSNEQPSAGTTPTFETSESPNDGDEPTIIDVGVGNIGIEGQDVNIELSTAERKREAPPIDVTVSAAVQAETANASGDGTVTPPDSEDPAQSLEPVIVIGRELPFIPEKYNVVIPTRGISEKRLIHDDIAEQLEDQFLKSINDDNDDHSNVFSFFTKYEKRQTIFPQTVRALPQENAITSPIIDKGEDLVSYYYHLTSGALHLDGLDSNFLAIPTNIFYHLIKCQSELKLPIEMSISIPATSPEGTEGNLKRGLESFGYHPTIIPPNKSSKSEKKQSKTWNEIEGRWEDQEGSWPDLGKDQQKTNNYTKANFEGDGPTMEDDLDYGPIAQGLGAFVKQEKTHLPLCVAIDGPWGKGKSSLMYMLREELDAGEHDAEKQRTKPFSIINTITQNIHLILLAFSPLLIIIFTVLGVLGLKYQSILLWAIPFWVGVVVWRVMDNYNNRTQTKPDEGEYKYETVFINAWRHGHGTRLTASIVHNVIKTLVSRHGPQFMMDLQLARFNSFTLMKSMAVTVIRSNFLIIFGALIAMEGFLSGDGASSLSVIFTNMGLPDSITSGTAITISAIAFRLFGKPSEVKVADFISSPNYEGLVGPDQEVEEDFRRVLDLLEKRDRKLALFIDDLDRCSPDTIHKVVEALNVFFGTESNKCLFILGMHREMVASSLEVAYDKVAKHVQNNCLLEEQRPFGRRFLEKIVQFVIHLPEPTEEAINRYIKRLTAGGNKMTAEETIATIEKLGAPQTSTQEKISLQLDIDERSAPEEDIEQKRAQIAFVDEQISQARNFDESSEENIAAFELVRSVLKSNPRQYKRFFNHLRFHNFIDAGYGLEDKLTMNKRAINAALSLEFPSVHYWMTKKNISFWNKNSTQIPETVLDDVQGRGRLIELIDIASNLDIQLK